MKTRGWLAKRVVQITRHSVAKGVRLRRVTCGNASPSCAFSTFCPIGAGWRTAKLCASTSLPFEMRFAKRLGDFGGRSSLWKIADFQGRKSAPAPVSGLVMARKALRMAAKQQVRAPPYPLVIRLCVVLNEKSEQPKIWPLKTRLMLPYCPFEPSPVV